MVNPPATSGLRERADLSLWHDEGQQQVSAAQRRRPHICFVAPLAWPVLAHAADIDVIGGAEVQQAILARSLARAGYRVSMI